MKIRTALLLAALAGLLPIEPAAAQEGPIYCRSNAQYATNTNGSTVLVLASTGRSIFVCGFSLFPNAAVTVSFVHGTGTTCATDETQLIPAYIFAAAGQISDQSSLYRGLFVPAGRDLCIKTSGAVIVQAQIFYVQR